MLIPLWKNYVEESEVNANHDLTVKSLRSNYPPMQQQRLRNLPNRID